MTSIPIEQAKSKLKELIESLAPGEELIITSNEQPIAKLTSAENGAHSEPRKPGSLRGTVTYIAPDFDEPLDEFKDYMP